jgi:hypothetical protein
VRSLNCSSVLISLCFFSSIFVPFAFASVQRPCSPVFCSSVHCAHLFPSVCISRSSVFLSFVSVLSLLRRDGCCCYSWCMITVRKGSEGWCFTGGSRWERGLVREEMVAMVGEDGVSVGYGDESREDEGNHWFWEMEKDDGAPARSLFFSLFLSCSRPLSFLL